MMSLPEGIREDFPDDAADLIDAAASTRFAEGHGKYGEGRNWHTAPPGYMLLQAQKKLLEAEEHVHAGRPEEAVTAMGDALNYMRFEADARVSTSDDGEEVGE